MQLKKLSPIAASLLLASLLSACGGGKGDDEAPAPASAATGVTAVTASAASLSSPSRAVEDKPLQFAGGECGGGTAPYTTTWSFGDGTATSSVSTHTYADPGTYSVTVTCTDSKNITKTSTALSLVVASEAMAGFLGHTWSAYAAIDTANRFLYPVAGIATSGDVYGLWLRSNADPFRTYLGTTDVGAGSTNFSATSWTMEADPQVGTLGNMATFDGIDWQTKTATMDMAVSPGGKAMAAWKAGSSLWYSTKNGSGSWSAPAVVNGPGAVPVPIIDASIKVVVNDAGDGAIAYCTATGASVVLYSGNTMTMDTTPEVVSKQCETAVSFSNLQRRRSFDIAINNDSTVPTKVIAVGLVTSGSDSVVSLKSNQAGSWTSPTVLSDPLTNATPTTTATHGLPSNFSVSYSLSPDGSVEGVAWVQTDMPSAPSPQTARTNVMAKIKAGVSWGATVPVQALTIYDYSRPLIAVADNGQAFLAMERPTTPTSAATSRRTYVSNYASATGWRAPVATDSSLSLSEDDPFNATDIAIDKYGTGLITRAQSNSYTQAGTFSKEGVWSGFTNIAPSTALTPFYSNFHYQTMRALPDGRAILVTSVGAATDTSPRSGYLLLQ